MAAPASTTRRILVVDDDPSIRRMLERTLQAEGYATRTATRAGRSIALTGREAALLALLVSHAGQVVSRDEALTTVWGDGRLPTANTVDRYVAYLRRKLGPPPLIHTVRGVGFVLRG